MKIKITILLAILFLISCEREVSMTIPLPISDDFGKLYINSNPQGATIFLNGRNMGKTTPDTIKWLPFGVYNLELKKKLYYQIKDSIFIDEQKTYSLEYDYFSDPKVYGKFRVGSYPTGEADIYINGEKTNRKTPFIFSEMSPGEYLIKCFLPEHRSDSISFELSSSQYKYISILVDDTSKVVKYNSKITNKQIDYVNKLRFLKNGELFFISHEEGLFKFQSNNVFNYNEENSPISKSAINDFIQDKEGKIWIATGNGIATLHNYDWEIYNSSNSGLPSNGVFCITIDEEGNRWIGTDEGLAKFDINNNWEVYTPKNSKLPAYLITAIDCDEEGTVYVGTNGVGVAKFDGTSWELFTKVNSGIHTDYVNLIKAIDKDNILICTLNEPGLGVGVPGGLSCLSGKKALKITTPKGSAKIYDINIIDNEIWCSTGECSFKMAQNLNILEVFDGSGIEGFPQKSIVTFDIDKYGNKWIGTQGSGFAKIK